MRFRLQNHSSPCHAKTLHAKEKCRLAEKALQHNTAGHNHKAYFMPIETANYKLGIMLMIAKVLFLQVWNFLESAFFNCLSCLLVKVDFNGKKGSFTIYRRKIFGFKKKRDIFLSKLTNVQS